MFYEIFFWIFIGFLVGFLSGVFIVLGIMNSAYDSGKLSFMNKKGVWQRKEKE